jgi:predicted nuclease of predicted toxin-antitoxin system
MKLLADESVDRPVVERLRQEGHDVVYIAELSPSIKDEEVLRQANDRGALLLTADKDFGELIQRERKSHAGIILIRLAGLSSAAKAEMVSNILRERASELSGALTVISPGLVRIRSAQDSNGSKAGTEPTN